MCARKIAHVPVIFRHLNQQKIVAATGTHGPLVVENVGDFYLGNVWSLMIAATWKFIKSDYESHRVRLGAEALGMLISLAVALIIMVTTPAPPLLLCYILWECASALLVAASYSRGSLGLTALYSGFLVIDFVGLVRTVLA